MGGDFLTNSKTPFYDFLSYDNEMSCYFNTLPKNVQETIAQSNGDIKTVGDLKSIAEGLLKNH